MSVSDAILKPLLKIGLRTLAPVASHVVLTATEQGSNSPINRDVQVNAYEISERLIKALRLKFETAFKTDELPAYQTESLSMALEMIFEQYTLTPEEWISVDLDPKRAADLLFERNKGVLINFPHDETEKVLRLLRISYAALKPEQNNLIKLDADLRRASLGQLDSLSKSIPIDHKNQKTDGQKLDEAEARIHYLNDAMNMLNERLLASERRYDLLSSVFQNATDAMEKNIEWHIARRFANASPEAKISFVNDICSIFQLTPYQSASDSPEQIPSSAPEHWSERKNREETPPDFIERVWGLWMGKGLTSSHFFSADYPLYLALRKWRKKHELPFDLPSRKEANDRKLEGGIPSAAESFGRALRDASPDVREKVRLYDVARRRQARQKLVKSP